MKIIGFDPGSRYFGIGLLEKKGNKISYLYSEVINLEEKDLLLRFKTLWEKLDVFFANQINDISNISASIEDGFVGKNIKSADTLAKIRGIIIAALISRKIEYKMFSPREIKKALTGNGNADKGQISKMVSTLLNINTDNIKDDETDALAIAYCHALSKKKNKLEHDINNKRKTKNKKQLKGGINAFSN